jgi:hypothetical protein
VISLSNTTSGFISYSIPPISFWIDSFGDVTIELNFESDSSISFGYLFDSFGSGLFST